MKKFGTPIGTGPGVASEKVGFDGAGDPFGLVSFGTGLVVATGFESAVSGLAPHPEPEVEIEHGLSFAEADSVFAERECFFVAGFVAASLPGAAVGAGEAAGVLSPCGAAEALGAA